MNTPSNPAHILYVKLATSVATRPLHYRSGNEETSAIRFYNLFKSTRELMEQHQGHEDFLKVALYFLNIVLHPRTSRWHGWMTQDDPQIGGTLRFRDEWVRRKFRQEMQDIHPELLVIQDAFYQISRGKKIDQAWAAGDKNKENLLAHLQADPPSSTLGQLPSQTSTETFGRPVELTIRKQIPLFGADAAGKTTEDLSPHILTLESAFIRKRRQAMSQDIAATPEGIVFDTTGLALSGGGIRSATFCLGIVQALYKKGLFNQVDYMSTVSGGGYLGTFLSSYLGTPKEAPTPAETTPLAPASTPAPAPTEPEDSIARVRELFDSPTAKSSESPPLRHLRNNSKYLLSGGLKGLLRIAGVLISGFMTSLLMLLTIPLLFAWLSLGIQELTNLHGFQWLKMNNDWLGGIFRQPGGSLFFVSLALLFLSFILKPNALRLAEGQPWESLRAKISRSVETMWTFSGIATLLFGGLCLSYFLVEGYPHFLSSLKKLIPALSSLEIPEWFGTLLLGLIPLFFGLYANRKGGHSRPWATGLFFLTGPLFFLLIFVIFAHHLGVRGSFQERVDAPDILLWSKLLGLVWSSPSYFIWGSLTGLVWSSPSYLVESPPNYLLWGSLTILLLLWDFLFININHFAPHRFYREKLCKCYLATSGKPQSTLIERGYESLVHGRCVEKESQETFVSSVKSLPLTQLCTTPAAPYHLINAVLNAESSRNPELRGRNGDFFLFSRYFSGSPLTGYIPTEELEKVEPGLDLGTAMAISGAAASTSMGWKTLRSFRFLMALFNVRLGYWMRRPGSLRPSWPFESPGPLYFYREMLGLVHQRSSFINLSDGGHIENLAAYELLRRQCKFIICVDAGVEPGMECSDLMRLQRYAAIDFGIQMHFDLSDLTLLPTSYSRAYAILVKIDYAPGQTQPNNLTSKKLGWMLYLKLAVTGTEPHHVLDYRRQNPAFPHQSTADQFYDEAQFESYRALGECAVESLCRDEILDTTTELKMGQWFESLAKSLLPDNDEVFEEGFLEPATPPVPPTKKCA